MDDAGDEPISFGTDGWRTTHSEITPAKLHSIGHAVARYLDSRAVDGSVAIGYDARHNSRKYALELASALTSSGREVRVPERDCPTPVLAWTVATGTAVAGLMVTASHNPPEYNGVKFLDAAGAPALPTVTDAIEEYLIRNPASSVTSNTGSSSNASSDSTGQPTTESAENWVDAYIENLLEWGHRLHQSTIRRENSGSSVPEGVSTKADTTLLGEMTVGYDAMFGSARNVTDRVLSRAGATVERLHCERDADFGGVAPEPKPDTVTDLVILVEQGDADIGVVNDGDGDRVGIVTQERGLLDANVLLALIYEFVLHHSEGDVVRTVSTSSLVDRIASSHGQTVHETAVGFKWVAASMDENDALVGGEESGGYGLTDHLLNKDGIMTALLVCMAHRERAIDDRIDSIHQTYGAIQQGRRSVECPESVKTTVLEAIEREFEGQFAGTPVESTAATDGFKVTLTDGSWVLVRPSGTEPKLRCYAEGDSDDRVDELLTAGVGLLESTIDKHTR